MTSRLFDHIDLRVSSFATARKFYDVLLPALGFPNIRAAESEITYYAEGERKMTPFIGMNEQKSGVASIYLTFGSARG